MVKRRLAWAIGIVLLVAVVVPWIAVPGAKARILASIQTGLGRSVEADAVHLRLLPLPGVELDNVQLADDPAFGAEPLAYADDAVATLSFSALLRGHLAFSRIHLDNASINLVRNRQGRWNVSALLDQTSTVRGRSGGRALAASVRFPYFELADSRVNFKLEQVKSRFYLADVQASLRRESDHWQLSLRFQPLRTDLNLSNTGEVTVDGRWGLAPAAGFRQLPFDLAIRLRNSYLAGSSALFAGHDAGLHGVLSADARVQGTAASYRITGSARAQSLRRWDLLPPPTAVEASFRASYIPSQDRLLLDGLGDPSLQTVRLQGEVDDVFAHPRAQLALHVQRLAAADLLPIVEAVKAHVPAGLNAAGALSGDARLAWPAPPRGADAADFHLAGLVLRSGRAELRVPNAEFRWDGRQLRVPAAPATVAGEAVALSAELDGRGFTLGFTGPALTRNGLAALAGFAGLRSPWPLAVPGPARWRLQLGAPWSSYRKLGWTGTAAAIVDGSDVWRALHPSADANVFQRMLGGGASAAVPAWLEGMRGPASFDLGAADARGAFALRRGGDRLDGRFQLRGDAVALDRLEWRTAAGAWRGAGTATLRDGRLAAYDLTLARGRRQLHLASPAKAQ